MNPYPIVVVSNAKSEKTPGLVLIQYFGEGERTIGSIEFKEQRMQLLASSATKVYAGQNNEHDYLDYGYASLDGLVSLNRLSVGCGTTPRRQSGDFTGV